MVATILAIAAALADLVIVYILFIRPWQLRWGATDEEVARPMPGDEIEPQPTFNATRAVTIRARPEEIWPWIVQIGFTRAGWYSYDWIDNLGRPSAERIVPEIQNLDVGDRIPMSAWTYQVVHEIVPYKHMVWVGGDAEISNGSWVWGLYPIDERRTRLVVRMRGRYKWASPWILLLLLVDVGDIIMMRKCMLGIKERAEKLAEGRSVRREASAPVRL